MIFGHIDNLDLMRSWLPAPVVLALEYLKNADYSDSPGGRETRIAPGITAKDNRLSTKPVSEVRAEAHQGNLDIQFLISGRERIGVAPDLGNNPISENNLAERDVVFFSSVRNESFIDFAPGNFAVLFPHDVHRPTCAPEGKPETIHKVVVKIRTDLL